MQALQQKITCRPQLMRVAGYILPLAMLWLLGCQGAAPEPSAPREEAPAAEEKRTEKSEPVATSLLNPEGFVKGKAFYSALAPEPLFYWINAPKTEPAAAPLWTLHDEHYVNEVRDLIAEADLPFGDLILALMDELRGRSNAEQFAEMGLLSQPSFCLYGTSQGIVFHLEIADGRKLERVFDALNQRWKFNLHEAEVDGLRYRALVDQGFKLGLFIAPRELSLFITTDEMLESLVAAAQEQRDQNQTIPTELDSLAEVNLLGLAEELSALSKIAELIGLDERLDACGRDFLRIAEHLPRLQFRTRSHDDYVEFEASLAVANTTFVADLLDMMRGAPSLVDERSALFELMVMLDIRALLLRLQLVAGEISEQPFECPALIPLNGLSSEIAHLPLEPGAPLRFASGSRVVVYDFVTEPEQGSITGIEGALLIASHEPKKLADVLSPSEEEGELALSHGALYTLRALGLRPSVGEDQLALSTSGETTLPPLAWAAADGLLLSLHYEYGKALATYLELAGPESADERQIILQQARRYGVLEAELRAKPSQLDLSVRLHPTAAPLSPKDLESLPADPSADTPTDQAAAPQ